MKASLRLAGLLTAMALVSSSSLAQPQVSPMELRAAFIVNFARFTEWPTGAFADGAPISLCVVDGDEQASDMLRRPLNGRGVSTRELAIGHSSRLSGTV